jgi:hypothetical protein
MPMPQCSQRAKFLILIYFHLQAVSMELKSLTGNQARIIQTTIGNEIIVYGVQQAGDPRVL